MSIHCCTTLIFSCSHLQPFQFCCTTDQVLAWSVAGMEWRITECSRRCQGRHAIACPAITTPLPIRKGPLACPNYPSTPSQIVSTYHCLSCDLRNATPLLCTPTCQAQHHKHSQQHNNEKMLLMILDLTSRPSTSLTPSQLPLVRNNKYTLSVLTDCCLRPK